MGLQPATDVVSVGSDDDEPDAPAAEEFKLPSYPEALGMLPPPYTEKHFLFTFGEEMEQVARFLKAVDLPLAARMVLTGKITRS